MNLASLIVSIGADIKDLEKGLSRASRAIEDTGKRMTELGSTLTKRVTAPLTALAGVAVRSFGIQEKAELQLRAALQANGRAVEDLFGQYNAFASEMQRLTVVGDETTLAMLAQAEALGITGDSAQRAVRNSIAMQSAFGVNAQSALRYTAALEEGNASMLARYIPALREIEDESQRVAKAQEILSNAFSVAEAEAQGTNGQIIQLKNAFGDLLEVVGSVVAEAILPFVRRAKEVVEQLQLIDRDLLKSIITWGALGAAIPVAMVAIGKFAGAIAALMTPLTLKIAALAALASGINWLIHNVEPLAEVFKHYFGLAADYVLDSVSSMLMSLAKLAEFMGHTMVASLHILSASIQQFKSGIDPDGFEFPEFIGFMEAIKLSGQGITEMFKDWIFTGSGAKATIQSIQKAGEDLSVGFGVIRQGYTNTALAMREVDTEARKIPESGYQAMDAMMKLGQAQTFAHNIAMDFTSSFGQGMANVVVQGERLVDTLKNIGKLLASAVIQKGLQALLMGGLGGTGFFGAGGGLLGKLFSVNDALITSGGDVVKFHPDDNILAMKDFSNLSGMTSGGAQRVEVFGRISANDIYLSSERGGNAFSR